MSNYRYSEENRVRPETPVKTRCTVEWLRRRATRRKLVLLEAAIIRHAPFADCGRTLLELLPEQPYFGQSVPTADYIRFWRAASPEQIRELQRTWPPSPLDPLDGHQAFRWFEDHPDGRATDDELVRAEYYFERIEYDAESDRFEFTPESRSIGSELRYGIADWLCGSTHIRPESWNVIDYYLANYAGYYDIWAGWRPLHPEHREVVLGVIHDVLGHPLRPARLDPVWRTEEAIAVARVIYDDRQFELMPILADALEEAGCDNLALLDHCRSPGLHVRGCWVVDLILGKE